VCASAAVSVPSRRALRLQLARRAPAAIAVILVLLGVIAVAVRLDSPADGTIVSVWQADGVVVTVPDPAASQGLQTGDLVTGIAGHRLADGLGGLTRPALGDELQYDIVRNGPSQVTVTVERPDPYRLLVGWGNLIFIVALAAFATALYFRRPEEPATTPLLITAAAFLGTTISFDAGLPALALATSGPLLWLYNLNSIFLYAVGWGALLAFAWNCREITDGVAGACSSSPTPHPRRSWWPGWGSQRSSRRTVCVGLAWSTPAPTSCRRQLC
jgi:hypothetical protein